MSALAEFAQQAVEAKWAETHAEATAAVKQVLGEIALGDVNMTKRHEDRSVPLVVWSDGTVSLAARREQDVWRVYLVSGSGSEWSGPLSPPLTDLASLGDALAAR